MSSLPTYTPEENLRRIKIQKIKFVVVEGIDDVPIYESFISSIEQSTDEFDVIFAGGKINIRNYIKNHNPKNAIFIIDKDFNDIEIESDKLVSLNRYSIENYFICEDVICHALQFVLNCKYSDIRRAFSLTEFMDEIGNAVTDLIKVIYYYQKNKIAKNIDEQAPSWSNTFICETNNWKLCRDKIQALIIELTQNNFTIEQARTFFDADFQSNGHVSYDFPGKMLKTSLQRYIRNEISKIKPSAKGKFRDVEDMRLQLSAAMRFSQELKDLLLPVISFVKLS
jgi:hypothetical protein